MAAMTVFLDAISKITFNFNTVIISSIRIFLNFIYRDRSPPELPPPMNHQVAIPMENDQTLQIDGEYVLYDAMDIVCKYADAKSLYNMTKVSKSWHEAALREQNKRLPLIEQWNGSLLRLSDMPIIGRTKAIPFATLFFYKRSAVVLRVPRENTQDYNRTAREHIILTKYREQLPNKAMALRVNEYFTMENAKIQCLEEQGQNQEGPTGDRDIMGLFFPSVDSRVCFHAASITDGIVNENEDHAVERLTEELGLNDSVSKSTILMFSIFSANPYLRLVIEKLMRRHEKKGKEITFAGFYGTKIRLTEDNRPCVCCGELRLLLRISGPRIESWGTFIYFCADRDEINRKLFDLKKRVESKRHYIGLVYAPKCTITECDHFGHLCGNNIELMKTVTRVFPYIRFSGLFVNCAAKVPLGRYGDRLFDLNKKMDEKYLNDSLVEKQGSCVHASIIIISHD